MTDIPNEIHNQKLAQRKEFRPEAFAEKVQHLKEKVLPKYEIEQRCLTLEDI